MIIISQGICVYNLRNVINWCCWCQQLLTPCRIHFQINKSSFIQAFSFSQNSCHFNSYSKYISTNCDNNIKYSCDINKLIKRTILSEPKM